MSEVPPIQALCDALEPVIERAVERALQKVLPAEAPRWGQSDVATATRRWSAENAEAWSDCVADVADLLSTLFSKTEAIIELKLSHHLLSVLPADGVDAIFFRELAASYRRRGLLNARFFEELIGLREGQREAIEATREQWAHLWR